MEEEIMVQEVIDEIRNIFILIKSTDGYYKLKTMPYGYDGYVVSHNDWKGVGIKVTEKIKDFVYNFENIRIKVNFFRSKSESFYMLELLTNQSFDCFNFSLICANFLNPGEDGEERNLLIEDPQQWVNKWSGLIGDKKTSQTIYPAIGELVVLKYLFSKDKSAKMTSFGSVDIETITANYEVKTTINRYNNSITIHSKYQLNKFGDKPLYLYFVRLEKSLTGVSLNSLIDSLKQMDYDVTSIVNKYENINSELKNECFRIDEIKEYEIDENFPKIVDSSFLDGKLPENIVGLEYTINLAGLPYNNIEIENK